jgi:hypothetical protein
VISSRAPDTQSNGSIGEVRYWVFSLLPFSPGNGEGIEVSSMVEMLDVSFFSL